jgi:RHS repeat-associated protein
VSDTFIDQKLDKLSNIWYDKIVAGADGIAALNPIRYRGYYYDTHTGLYYLQSRYYNPEWGRFII